MFEVLNARPLRQVYLLEESRQDQDGRQSPQPLRIPTHAAQEFIAPFLTEKGLAKLVGGGTDSYFPLDATTSMTPTDTHGHLRRFLRDNFRFGTTHDIYGFLTPLSSANLHNNSWTQEEGQLLLETLTSTQEEGQLLLETLTSNIGRLRIAEIVTWPQVSPTAGMSREILSFQRGLIPLLRYMSSDFVVQSTLRTQAKYASLMSSYMECTELLLANYT
ncbi:hypothetical protein AZE42_01785 [Rhizopogon vesiculosus]|uniref:Uncharacterized protein n=1 Tax=Rhizopogon vesiculosus TaxID=180088 RepID=A0A1J8QYR4_9AGAM|nr:hypothetical protein AZE42_01785 [Rhizopogon vesiculosus]